MPHLPPGVRLECSHSKGRFLVADRDFAPGEVVVSQLPYASVLFSEHTSRFCNYCFRPGNNLRRCSRSKFAHYCSKDHQSRDWQEGYKYECEFLQKCSPRRPPESCRLAARVVWKRMQEIEKGLLDSSDVWDTYQGVDSLDDHFEDLPISKLQDFAQIGFFLSRLCPHLPEEGLSYNESVEKSLAKLVAKFAFNNHTISCSSETSLGCGVYPLLAMVNHSSWPNCIQTFNNKLCQFRAICPIKAGDELTITYVDLVSTSIERRDILKEGYLFDSLADIPSCKPNRTIKTSQELVVELWKKNQPSWLISDKDVKITEVLNSKGQPSGGVMLLTSPADSRFMSDLNIGTSNTDDVNRLGTKEDKSQRPAIAQFWGEWASGRLDARKIGKKVLEMHSFVVEGKALMDSGSTQQALSTLQEGWNLMLQPLVREYYLSEMHILRFKAMDFLLKAAIESGNEWNLAIQCARKMVPMLNVIYPHYWSERGSHLAVLSKLESNFGELESAVQAAEESVHILRITDGSGDVFESMKELSIRLKHELDYICHQKNN